MVRRMENFNEIINRYNTNSCKWDECKEKCGKDVLQLAVADMDFKSPKEILEKMFEIVKHGIFGYTMLPKTYFDSIVNWYSKRYNWDIKKEWILYSPRVGIGVSLIIKNMTEIGDSIIMLTPAYPPLKDAIVKNNRKLIEVPLILENNKYVIDFKNLEKSIEKNTKIFLLCNPHNPTGRVFNKLELEKIVDFCDKNNLLIVSDEIHCDLIFNPNKHIPIGMLEKAKERSVICSSITKTFNVPGVITSNLIIPNFEIRERMKKILDVAMIHNPNIFAAGITEVAYNECEYWLEEVINYIFNNRLFLKKYLEVNFPKLKLIDAEGTYLAWIDFRKLGLDDKELESLFINKCNVNVYIGEHFGEVGKGFIRVNLATPKENIEKFLKSIEKIYN
jgi:cystathionine beta-lyase